MLCLNKLELQVTLKSLIYEILKQDLTQRSVFITQSMYKNSLNFNL